MLEGISQRELIETRWSRKGNEIFGGWIPERISINMLGNVYIKGDTFFISNQTISSL